MVWIDITNIAFSIGDFLFNEAHWMFAFYYMKIAKNLPKVIEKSDEPQKSYRTVFWVGVVVNAVMSLGELSIAFWSHHPDSKLLQLCVVVSTSGSQLCEIASGIILISSVHFIWSYLKKSKENPDQFNMRTRILHSASFGLFLLSAAVIAVTYGFYVFTHEAKANLWANIVYYCLSFVSQCLLCIIFWIINTK